MSTRQRPVTGLTISDCVEEYIRKTPELVGDSSAYEILSNPVPYWLTDYRGVVAVDSVKKYARECTVDDGVHVDMGDDEVTVTLEPIEVGVWVKAEYTDKPVRELENARDERREFRAQVTVPRDDWDAAGDHDLSGVEWSLTMTERIEI